MTAPTPRRASADYTAPKGHCRGCGEPIDKAVHPRAKTWHPACAERWREQQPQVQRWRLEDRDHGVCAACGVRTEDRRQRCLGAAYWHEVRLLDYIPSPDRYRTPWGRLTTWTAIQRGLLRHDLPRTVFKHLARTTGWEADHRVPLWAGGANDLTNLQTLCIPCHRDKTRAEARERADLRRQQDPQIQIPGVAA